VPPTPFHIQLLEARKKRRLTQQELAYLAEARNGAEDIRRWEKGVNLPQTPSVKRLAEALDAPGLVQAALDRADALDAARRARRGRRRGT